MLKTEIRQHHRVGPYHLQQHFVFWSHRLIPSNAPARASKPSAPGLHALATDIGAGQAGAPRPAEHTDGLRFSTRSMVSPENAETDPGRIKKNWTELFLFLCCNFWSISSPFFHSKIIDFSSTQALIPYDRFWTPNFKKSGSEKHQSNTTRLQARPNTFLYLVAPRFTSTKNHGGGGG